jgi:hypothetical protein
MPQLNLLYATRSDAKTHTRLANGQQEENAPTPEQLSRDLKKDQKTGAKVYNYLRELKPEDQKHFDWRHKLGMLLATHAPLNEHMKGID